MTHSGLKLARHFCRFFVSDEKQCKNNGPRTTEGGGRAKKEKEDAGQKKKTQKPERILARTLARQLSKDELRRVAGGLHSSSEWSCSDAGDGDDGGADD